MLLEGEVFRRYVEVLERRGTGLGERVVRGGGIRKRGSVKVTSSRRYVKGMGRGGM